MLTNYRNDLFATRSDLNAALTQVNDVYANALTTADSIAMRTAVHIVLNTAIQQHIIELTAIYDKHAAEVHDLRSKLAARPDAVTALLSLVDERIDNALDERMDNVFADKFDDAIDSWADEKLSDKVSEAIDLDDAVQEKIEEYFSSNTFSIDRR